MSRVQTDNSYFAYKVKLRLENLPKKKNFAVLDCFCGDGRLWTKIKQLLPDRDIRVLGLDKKAKTQQLHLIGDNIKFLKAVKLQDFDVIDLDAYGSPYKQLQFILRAKSKTGQIIYATFIQSLYGGLPAAFLADLGYPQEMVRKIPTLFYRNGFKKLKQYLADNGVDKIKGYSDYPGRKHYFCFKVP